MDCFVCLKAIHFCLEVLEVLAGFIVDIIAEFSLLESKAAHSLSSSSESQAHRL